MCRGNTPGKLHPHIPAFGQGGSGAETETVDMKSSVRPVHVDERLVASITFLFRSAERSSENITTTYYRKNMGRYEITQVPWILLY